MKQINGINNSSQNELTYEQLKKYKGFEDITETQAEKEIENIKRLAKILYYLYINEQQTNNNEIDEQ
jgi:hypothetical protein